MADMHVQVRERDERIAGANGDAAHERCCGALAVVAGSGMRELYGSLGVDVLDGGATLNPSTQEILAGIHQVPAEQVVVLPNSPNVIMAAERAAELSDKEVRVVHTRSQQAGLAAAVALVDSRTAETNAAAMEREVERLRTGAVARAARDDAQGRFSAGDAVGFVDDAIVAWGEPAPTLEAVRRARSARTPSC